MDLVKFSPHRRLATDSRRLLFLICFCLTPPVWSQDSGASTADADVTALLERFADEVGNMAADFEQKEFDQSGELLDDPAAGRFLLLRPNRFLWHRDAPFEQIDLADGDYLWSYDVELEQATRAPLSKLEDSPAMLLLSGEGTVGENYRVAKLSTDDGREWIELSPVDAAASNFSSVKIAFSDNVPALLELVNGLGDLTVIEFFNLEVNTDLDDSDFRFDPPAGVHVVEMDD